MKITASLKGYLAEAFKLPADASDDAIQKCVTEKLFSGELTPEKLAELTVDKSAAEKLNGLIKSQVDAAIAPVATAIESLAKALTGKTEEKAKTYDKKDADPITGIDDEDEDSHSKMFDEIEARIEKRVNEALEERVTHSRINPVRLLGRSGNPGDPRVKSVAEMFSTTKSAVQAPDRDVNGNATHHPFAGREVRWDNKRFLGASDLEKACVGAWLKSRYHATKPVGFDAIPKGMRMNDLDDQLLKYAVHEMPWYGMDGDDVQMFEKGIKATQLLDDNTSGGLELAPIAFDDMIIEIPLLYGQVFPQVEVVNIARGRRIEGGQINNPTWSSGPAEGTAITLETTDGFCSALDTTIFPSSGSIEVGLDFADDSPVAIAERLSRLFGYSYLKWLDNVIINGNGSTEPLGVLTASGTTAVNSALGVNGPAAIGDAEALFFAVSLQVKAEQGARNCFVGRESAYGILRGIPVGNNDARRVLGEDYGSYQVLGKPFKLQNDMAATTLLFGNFGYYRLYRRKGMGVRVVTEGKDLARANTLFMVARGRDGGRPMLGSAFAKMTDFSST